MTPATPRPWHFGANDRAFFGGRWRKELIPICADDTREVEIAYAVSEQDAALIVQAVNSHYALVEALEAVVHCNDYCYALESEMELHKCVTHVTAEFSKVLKQCEAALAQAGKG